MCSVLRDIHGVPSLGKKPTGIDSAEVEIWMSRQNLSLMQVRYELPSGVSQAGPALGG